MTAKEFVRVRRGDRIHIKRNDLLGKPFEGTVKFFYSTTNGCNIAMGVVLVDGRLIHREHLILGEGSGNDGKGPDTAEAPASQLTGEESSLPLSSEEKSK